jgi:hypothetical protein
VEKESYQKNMPSTLNPENIADARNTQNILNKNKEKKFQHGVAGECCSEGFG